MYWFDSLANDTMRCFYIYILYISCFPHDLNCISDEPVQKAAWCVVCGVCFCLFVFWSLCCPVQPYLTRPLLSFAGMDGDPDLNFLLNGAELVKVRSGSWRKARFYKLQEDCKTVWHESKKTLRPKHTCESIPHTRVSHSTMANVEMTTCSVYIKSSWRQMKPVRESGRARWTPRMLDRDAYRHITDVWRWYFYPTNSSVVLTRPVGVKKQKIVTV